MFRLTVFFLLFVFVSQLYAEPLFEENESSLIAEEILSEEAIPEEDTLDDDLLEDVEDEPIEDDFLDEDLFFFEAFPLIFEAPVFEIRSFSAIFPSISQRQITRVMSEQGLRSSFANDESPRYLPDPDSGIDLFSKIMEKKPSHIIEALVVVPYNEMEIDLLDIYNALGRIEKLKDYTASFGVNDIHVFTESTRIESSSNRRAIPDPPPAVTLPFSETMYLRLREFSIGNLFLRGDISINMYGLTYSMTNFADVRYFFIPIMRAERYLTIIYLEPIEEGILIYSMTGFYLPGFIADRINLTPNINRRIQVFLNWITDGLRAKQTEQDEAE